MTAKRFRPQMTDSERKRGWVFFGLYILVLPYLTAIAQRLIFGDGESPVAEANIIYYGLLFALALLVFWSFLRHGFTLLLDWLPENLFAIATGLGGWAVLSFLVGLLPMPVENPVPMQYLQEYAISPTATVLLVVLLMPLIEETLFRGLVFGSLRRYSRVLAYVVSVLVFAFCSVWRYALGFGDAQFLLLGLQYLPAGLALAWCYDNGGSIWGTIGLRMAMSGI
ncbi:MAG: CPBP family intramembrane glutamic endopeptidase, partial [Pseudoflavonifractor sp.]